MHNGAIMPSEVRHLVNDGRPYPVVRLSGVLDATSAGTVRSVLLDVLAGQPEAVVVDVGDLALTGADSGEVLREIHRDTVDWPAARLALCDSREPDRWQSTGWPVWPDPRQAFAALGPPQDDHRVSLGLEPQVGAARRSRELITDACDRWSRPELAGSACIVVTEMVNNVVAHAQTPMVVLVVAHGAGVSVAVRDHSGTMPSYTGEPVAPTSYGGRGMLLIDTVADRWGSLILAEGKVVWALLADDGVPPDAPGGSTGGASMAGGLRG
jgi:hypothetical protein